MTELERMLVTALTKQNEHVNALTERLEDLLNEHDSLAEHVQRLSELLRGYWDS